MSFARTYLSRPTTGPLLIEEEPDPGLGMVVMIPACGETELLRTMDSLAGCLPAGCGVEVVVLINEAVNCRPEISRVNACCMNELEQWKTAYPEIFFRLYPLRPAPFPEKHAGVGLARKTAMDEAVRRFDRLDRPEGIIVSLDADTLVEKNYLQEIERLFSSSVHPHCATIRFEHRSGEIEDDRQREGIILYEAFLHYYKEALAWTGYPHPLYTIGSAFAVRADAYIRQGGMNRRQAGEDFYFLHKMTQLGPLAELDVTCVYPSARVSRRVPFGTGAALEKWVNGDSGLRQTYSLQSFADLKTFFYRLPVLRQQGWSAETAAVIPEPVLRFLEKDRFPPALEEIRRNSASQSSFEKRFFHYFNAFKILRFHHFTHPSLYPWQDLMQARAELEAIRAGCWL